MPRSPLIRLVMAAVAGAVAALALLALLDAASEGQGFSNTAAASNFGWLVPLVAGVVVAFVAVALLATPSDEAGQTSDETSQCPECGGTVRGEWRLCPHCGARLIANNRPQLRG